MRILITAGSTRERIDQVRDWGNIFTGNTGYAIAMAAKALGSVDLLTSNRAHVISAPAPIHATSFTTHADLVNLIDEHMQAHSYDAVFMSAAVSDYAPSGAFEILTRDVASDGSENWRVKPVQAGKIKSTYPALAIAGRPTEKIVDLFRTRWQHRGLLVKFKLEVDVSTPNLIEIGQTSRRASGAEYLVANTLDMVTGIKAGAYLLSDAGSEWVARDALPGRLVALVKRV